MPIVVPAAAATPLPQENCIINVRTGFVGGLLELEYNRRIENSGKLKKQRVVMKCNYTHWTAKGESTIRLNTDAEE